MEGIQVETPFAVVILPAPKIAFSLINEKKNVELNC